MASRRVRSPKSEVRVASLGAKCLSPKSESQVQKREGGGYLERHAISREVTRGTNDSPSHQNLSLKSRSPSPKSAASLHKSPVPKSKVRNRSCSKGSKIPNPLVSSPARVSRVHMHKEKSQSQNPKSRMPLYGSTSESQDKAPLILRDNEIP